MSVVQRRPDTKYTINHRIDKRKSFVFARQYRNLLTVARCCYGMSQSNHSEISPYNSILLKTGSEISIDFGPEKYLAVCPKPILRCLQSFK